MNPLDPFGSLADEEDGALDELDALDSEVVDLESTPTSLDAEERARQWMASRVARPPLSPSVPTSDQPGILRSAFEGLTSPLRAIGGLTGTSLVHALGIRAMFPEQYGRAARELEQDEARRVGPDVLKGAAALPGLGDVAVEGMTPEFRESLPGRVLEPVTRLGLNIAGDPTTYAGGAGLVLRAARAAKLAETAPRAAGIGARMLEAVDEAQRIGSTGRAVARTVTEMGARPGVGSTLRGAGRIASTLPFSPLVGAAYLPDVMEGVGAGLSQSFEELRAGRYKEAAATGTGALLTAGLGALVARGVISEARAARILERAVGQQLGEVDSLRAGTEGSTLPAGAGAGTQPSGGGLSPAIARPGGAGEGVDLAAGLRSGTGATPETPPPTSPGTPAEGPAPTPAPTSTTPSQPEAQPASPTLTPLPGSERLKVKRGPEVTQKLTELVERKVAEGQHFTKKDLVEAGLVSVKQAKEQSMEMLLDALGGTSFRSRLEPVSGYGYRVRAQGDSVASPPVNPGAQPAPVVESGTVPAGTGVAQPPESPATTGGVATPPGDQPPAPSAPTTPTTPTTSTRLTVPEIDRQLSTNPELRAMVDQTLDALVQDARGDLQSLNRTHVAAAFPGDENKATRALLNRALEARKKIARTPGPAPAPALTFPRGTFPGEARQPFRTPVELRTASEKAPEGGSAEKAREATGIGDRPVAPNEAALSVMRATGLAEPEPAITTVQGIAAARAELAQIRDFVAERPEFADELGERDIELQDAIESAIQRGVEVPDMPTAARAPRPEAPERRELEVTGPDPDEIRPQSAFDDRPLYTYSSEGTPTGTQKAINRFLQEGRMPVERFVSVAENLLGKKLDDATGDELNLVLTLAERQPEAFGQPRPESRLDPQLTETAVRRLTGGTEHLGETEGREFVYDPASPAGKVQPRARTLESTYGIPAEQELQDTMVRWIADLSMDDERWVRNAASRVEALVTKRNELVDRLEAAGKVEEAGLLREKTIDDARRTMALAQQKFESARNRRRLLLSPEPTASDELAKLLHANLSNYSKRYAGRDLKRAKEADKLIARAAASELTPDEMRRFAIRPPDELEDIAPTADRPPKPEGISDVDWDLLISIARSSKESVKGKGVNVSSTHMTTLKRIAGDLGVKPYKGENATSIMRKIVRKLKPAGPDAAIANLLTDELVSQRGPVWERAIAAGTRIGDTNARAVDFEGDAAGTIPGLSRLSQTADELSRLTANLSTTLDLPSTFGGFTGSAQLNGLRMMDGSIFLNPVAARHMAETEIAASGRPLEGEAHTSAVHARTAQNLVDTLFHELAHRRARHDAASGDIPFVTAYANAIRAAGAHYSDAIRAVRNAVEFEREALDSTLPSYRAAFEEVKRGREREQGDGAGTGEGGAAALARGPGGGERGAAGGGGVGVRPSAALREGGAGEAGGVRAGATAGEGAAGGDAGERGGVGGRGDVEPALTSAFERFRDALGIQAGDVKLAIRETGAASGLYNLKTKTITLNPSFFQPGAAVGARGAISTFTAALRHELAHHLTQTQHPAHSDAFWKKVDDVDKELSRSGVFQEVTSALNRSLGPTSAPSASLVSILSARLASRHQSEVFQHIQQRFAANLARFGGRPEDADRYLAELRLLSQQPEEFRAALRAAKPQGTIDIGKNLTKFPVDAMSDEQKEQLALALAFRNSTMSRATPMTEEMVRTAARRLLDTHTPEEFIDFAKVKGLRDPADWALLDSIAATFSREVDENRAMLRAAEIEAANATRTGNKTALADATDRAEVARGRIAQALMKRDEAIFTVIPETTRVARVLAFRRSIIHPLTPEETFKSRFFGVMRSSGIKKGKQDELYSLLTDTIKSSPGAPDWTRFVNAFRQATQPKLFDKFLEFWKAGLLGIPTQITNIATNAAFLGLRNSEHALTALVDPLFSGLTGAPRTRYIGESSARMHGGRTGLAEGWQSLREDFRDISALRPPDPVKRAQLGTFADVNLRQLYGAIPGKRGEFVRIPFKILDAFDNFFKHVIRNQEWSAQAHRLAMDPANRTGGEAVNHATARIYEELRRTASNPIQHQHLWKKAGYKEAIEAGTKAAIQDTFQEALVGSPLREIVKKWDEAANRVPAFNLVQPFRKTPYNIMAEAMKRTPIAAAWAIKKYVKGEIDNPAFVEAMVKSAMGTAVMATVFEMALNDQVTGSGPTDPKQLELLKRTGWQPRSLKVGNQYLSYQRLAPFSIALGLAADMAEAYKRKDIDTGNEMLEKGVLSLSQNIFDQSFVSGLDAIMKILTDPQRQGSTQIRQIQASLVPNIIGVVPVGHAARALDPVYRETEALTASPFLAQIPGLSQTLQPQLTPTGEERKRAGTTLERLFSPVQRSEVENDDIAAAAEEIARVGPAIDRPPLYFRVGQERVYYAPEERQAIAAAHEKAMMKVARYIRSSEYQRLPDAEDLAHRGQRTKRDAINSIINEYRRPITERMQRQALRRAELEK